MHDRYLSRSYDKVNEGCPYLSDWLLVAQSLLSPRGHQQEKARKAQSQGARKVLLGPEVGAEQRIWPCNFNRLHWANALERAWRATWRPPWL